METNNEKHFYPAEDGGSRQREELFRAFLMFIL